MARTALPDPDYVTAAHDELRAEPVAPADERDEIDEMFTGGP
mgnify:CR=1 FL=1